MDNFTELADRLKMHFDKCKDETQPGAHIAMIELRNMAPDLIDALRRAAESEAEYVEIARMKLGKQL